MAMVVAESAMHGLVTATPAAGPDMPAAQHAVATQAVVEYTPWLAVEAVGSTAAAVVDTAAVVVDTAKH
jgi:hypothetical protein